MMLVRTAGKYVAVCQAGNGYVVWCEGGSLIFRTLAEVLDCLIKHFEPAAYAATTEPKAEEAR